MGEKDLEEVLIGSLLFVITRLGLYNNILQYFYFNRMEHPSTLVVMNILEYISKYMYWT